MTKSTLIKNDRVIIAFKQALNDLNIEYEKIYLFGSRAKGKADENSDWDFYVVTKNSFTGKSEGRLCTQIRLKFHEYYPLEPLDVIVNDKDEFEYRKNIVNTIASEAITDGIQI